MKTITACLTFFGILLLSWSCTNDFDLVKEADSLPVVYGLVSSSDSIHYVRVEKSFVDPQTSALEIAKNPDSIYYANASVELQKLDGLDEVLKTYPMVAVDASQEGIPREEGIFATSPNQLYKLILPRNEKLEGGEQIRLVVNTGDNKEATTATTTIVAKPDFVIGRPASEIEFKEDTNIKIAWRVPEGGRIYNVDMVVNYLEAVPGSTTEFVGKSVRWNLVQDLIPAEDESTITFDDLEGQDFFRFLGNNIDDGVSLRRRFTGIDVILKVGGQELVDFLRVSQANTGLTGANNIPVFTNIENGIGLFSSRNQAMVTNIKLRDQSRDSLRDGRFTKNLNFD